MAIPNKQIGWSNESNLIWEISRQLEQLIGVAYAAGIKPYKVYSALLSATGEANPDATVLENTLGETITWTWDSTGTYFGQIAGTFDPLKTFINVQPGYYTGPYTGYGAVWQDDSGFIILSFYDEAGGLVDIEGSSLPVEIRVY